MPGLLNKQVDNPRPDSVLFGYFLLIFIADEHLMHDLDFLSGGERLSLLSFLPAAWRYRLLEVKVRFHQPDLGLELASQE